VTSSGVFAGVSEGKMSFTGPKGTVHERKGILQLDGMPPSEALAGSGEVESTLVQRRDSFSAPPEQQDGMAAPSSFPSFQQSPARRPLMTRKRSGNLLAPSESSAAMPTSPVAYTELSGSMAGPAALFRIKGRRVRLSMTKGTLCWQYETAQCLGLASGPGPLRCVPLDDVLAVHHVEPTSQMPSPSSALTCCLAATCPSVMHRVVVHTIKRRSSKQCLWSLTALVLQTASAEGAAEWAASIGRAVDEAMDRPRSLLVFQNPHGGARRAAHVWKNVAAPIMHLAGIAYTVVTTTRKDHCRSFLEEHSGEELGRFDGVVAVGGDGLFQEVLNAVLTLRAAGGDKAAAAGRLRLGHIPAGSTDAVAYSLNGTRSQATAALHIALGDRAHMDVMRVDTGAGERRFCCCVAAYGYMGDLMAQSERMRCLGPSRYNLAGALTLFRNNSYRARVRYLPSTVQSYTARRVCGAHCEWCRAAGPHLRGYSHGEPHPDVFAAAAVQSPEAEPDGAWREVEGEFNAIMAVVMPCRSDRSDSGLAPFAHMADGIIHLILVRKCSALQVRCFRCEVTWTQPGARTPWQRPDCQRSRTMPCFTRWIVLGRLIRDCFSLTSFAHWHDAAIYTCAGVL